MNRLLKFWFENIDKPIEEDKIFWFMCGASISALVCSIGIIILEGI